MVKKEMLCAILTIGFIANSTLCEESEQPNAQKDDLVVTSEKKNNNQEYLMLEYIPN